MEGTYYTLCYLLHQYTLLCATNNNISRCYRMNVSDKSAIICTQNSPPPHKQITAQHFSRPHSSAAGHASPLNCDATLPIRLQRFKASCYLHFPGSGSPNINHLTPNDPYMGRTAPLTSKRCILYIYSTNIGNEYFEHALHPPFFFLFKMQFVS